MISEAFGVRGRGRFYEEVGAIRDVVQDHLLQVLSLLAMDRPEADDGDAIEASKVALLAAIRPLRRPMSCESNTGGTALKTE